MRLPAYRFDDDDATAAAIASLSGDDEASDAPPPLDDFPAGFWGTSATKSVLEILGDGSTKAFREREGVLAAFLCIFAAMRLHLRLMPSIMAKRVGARDTEAAEDALMEWSCQFAAHWFGPDFEREPILPTNIEKLSDFYRPLEGKNSPPPTSDGCRRGFPQVLGKLRKFSTSKPDSAEVAGSL
jgi:hypothetical protein